MASKEIQEQVKKKLFETWMPDKPGGLKGLVNMAADAALAVLGERVEFLEGELYAYENPGLEVSDEAGESFGDLSGAIGPVSQPNDASDDAPEPGLGWKEEGKYLSSQEADNDPGLVPSPELEVDQTKYLCPQCAVTHQRDSGVGTRHAHLFYGGTPAVVHLEFCPVLEDPEAKCTCNAVPASAADRATARRPPDSF